jgi:hypothetical protein
MVNSSKGLPIASEKVYAPPIVANNALADTIHRAAGTANLFNRNGGNEYTTPMVHMADITHPHTNDCLKATETATTSVIHVIQ